MDKQIGAVEKTGPPIGKNLADIINHVLFKSVIREKLVQKLEKHSLKIQRSENTKDAELHFKSSRRNLQVTNTLLELENCKNLNTGSR